MTSARGGPPLHRSIKLSPGGGGAFLPRATEQHTMGRKWTSAQTGGTHTHGDRRGARRPLPRATPPRAPHHATAGWAAPPHPWGREPPDDRQAARLAPPHLDCRLWRQPKPRYQRARPPPIDKEAFAKKRHSGAWDSPRTCQCQGSSGQGTDSLPSPRTPSPSRSWPRKGLPRRRTHTPLQQPSKPRRTPPAVPFRSRCTRPRPSPRTGSRR